MTRVLSLTVLAILIISFTVIRLLAPNLDKGLEAYRHSDWETARRHLEPIANSGNTEAQFTLGLMYENGSGFPRNIREAAKWFGRAAEQGSQEAQLELGRLNSNAVDAGADLVAARRWYLLAADNGNLDAQAELGALLRRRGTPVEDQEQALRWLHIAADRGSLMAKTELGNHYLYRENPPEKDRGLTFLKNAGDAGYIPAQRMIGAYLFLELLQEIPDPSVLEAAIYWYRLCANQLDMDCQYFLGEIYSEDTLGLSGKPNPEWDLEEAVKWYLLAANQGDVWAQTKLGTLYILGEGVPQDFRRAVALIGPGADQGLAHSQYYLGLLYVSGKGVPQDLVVGHMWLNLAAAQDSPGASREIVEATTGLKLTRWRENDAEAIRDRIAKEMTSEQLSKAQSLASNWKASKGGGPSLGGRIASTGSGFRINREGQFLTNNHVIEECSQILIIGDPVEVVAIDGANDLAVLGNGPSGGEAKFSSDDKIKPGSRVVATGFPLQGVLGSGLQTTSGEVSNLSGPGSDTRFLQVSVPINPGSSGGPLFDSYGLVAGVVTAKLDSLMVAEATGSIPENVGFALRSSIIKTFLDTNNIEYSTGRGWLKRDPEDIAERAQEVVVLVECVK